MVGSDVIVILYRGSQKDFTLGSHLRVNVVAINSLTRTLRYYFPNVGRIKSNPVHKRSRLYEMSHCYEYNAILRQRQLLAWMLD
jgi:hypothetical protein